MQTFDDAMLIKHLKKAINAYVHKHDRLPTLEEIPTCLSDYIKTQEHIMGMANDMLKHYEKMGSFTCCICGKKFYGWGNNPYPIKDDFNARCCDDCDNNVVIPARISVFTKRNNK